MKNMELQAYFFVLTLYHKVKTSIDRSRWTRNACADGSLSRVGIPRSGRMNCGTPVEFLVPVVGVRSYALLT